MDNLHALFIYKKRNWHNPLKYLNTTRQNQSENRQNRIDKLSVQRHPLSVERQLWGIKMSEDRLYTAGVVGAKRGVPIYESNPSVPEKGAISRTRKRQIGDEHKGLVIDDGSGEVLGRGTAVAYEWEEVDAERFVKLFLSGLKQAADLSKPGLAVFEVVYNNLRNKPNEDRVNLSFYGAKQVISDITDRTYQRGLKELLEKEFLFRSPFDGVFFVNIRYMFNGDRLAFVKAYHLKDAAPRQEQLPLLLPE